LLTLMSENDLVCCIKGNDISNAITRLTILYNINPYKEDC
jgi:hypothetical protein